MQIERLPSDAGSGRILTALKRDGAVVVERFVDEPRVARQKEELEAILRSVPTGRNSFEGYATRRIYALFAKTRAFDEEAIAPRVLDVLGAILGEGFLLSAPTGISIGPGEAAQTLHRDDGVYPLPRPHQELVVNTMWAVDDFTVENGATRLVPGSHDAASGDEPDHDTAITAEMPAGSLLIYLGSLLHGGGANRSEQPRLGVVLEYCAGWLRPQESHLLAVPKDVARALPERLQELLGYGIHGRLLGYVDGRHPRKVLAEPC